MSIVSCISANGTSIPPFSKGGRFWIKKDTQILKVNIFANPVSVSHWLILVFTSSSFLDKKKGHWSTIGRYTGYNTHVSSIPTRYGFQVLSSFLLFYFILFKKKKKRRKKKEKEKKKKSSFVLNWYFIYPSIKLKHSHIFFFF